jgi:hypothetical protein
MSARSSSPKVRQNAPVASPEAAGADAQLIAACAAFEALALQELALYHGPGAIKDDRERDEPLKPIVEAQKRVLDRMFELRASTAEGLRARVRAFFAYVPDQLHMWEQEGDYLTLQLHGIFVGLLTVLALPEPDFRTACKLGVSPFPGDTADGGNA